MNKLFHFRPFRLVMIVMLLALSFSLRAAEYYVVIGTFSLESNARAFVSEVRDSFKEVSYSYNAVRALYYVHVFKTARKEDARNWSLYLKNEKGFKDAWVLTNPNEVVAVAPDDLHGNPRYEATYDVPAATSPVIASSASGADFVSYEEKNGSGARPSLGARSPQDLQWTNSGSVSYIKNVYGVERSFESDAVNTFTFIVEDSEGREMTSEVMLVDFEKVKIITSFETRENTAIRGTRSGQMITFVCDELGYAQETRMYNIDHLARGRDIQKNDAGVWEVRFRLKKMEVNDIAFMNETVFQADAAVLERSSEKELAELLSMMQSNPGYKIIVHSHCSPVGKRFIRLPETSDNFFDITQSYAKKASDKRLTRERAATVRNYLVGGGVSKKRIGIIGWGSMDSLAKSNSDDGGTNDRIEFELVAE